MKFEIDYRKSARGRQAAKRWTRERDLGALIELLEHGIVPTRLVTALRDYRRAAGAKSLEVLLLGNRRGRGGNQAAEVIARARSEVKYAAVIAAQEFVHPSRRILKKRDRTYALVRVGKGPIGQGDNPFWLAAKFLAQQWPMGPEFMQLSHADRARQLRSLYYRRRKLGPLDDRYRRLVSAIIALMPSVKKPI